MYWVMFNKFKQNKFLTVNQSLFSIGKHRRLSIYLLPDYCWHKQLKNRNDFSCCIIINGLMVSPATWLPEYGNDCEYTNLKNRRKTYIVNIEKYSLNIVHLDNVLFKINKLPFMCFTAIVIGSPNLILP